MGSTYTIVAYGAKERLLAEAAEQAFEEIDRLDALLSNFKPTSELSEVNRAAAKGPVRVTPEFFRFLETADYYRRETWGAFDITLGRGRLSLDPRKFTAEFTEPDVKLDPGGIGKGLACDRAIEILKAAGITSALVHAGMSTINALGAPPGQDGWEIKVRSPLAKDVAVLTVRLKDESLSTSATYEKGRHIIDPRTRRPAETKVTSASAFAPTGVESDALTKCFFILGREGAGRYLRAHKQVRAFLCDPECSWVRP
jgi:thiamine biosynthesis lipoprotein